MKLIYDRIRIENKRKNKKCKSSLEQQYVFIEFNIEHNFILKVNWYSLEIEFSWILSEQLHGQWNIRLDFLQVRSWVENRLADNGF
jgi:hypothetical protein